MIAEVIINSNVKNLNRTFDYIIPTTLEDKVVVGSRIFVPFGSKKNLEEGFVVGLKEESKYLSKLKEIEKVQDKVYLGEDKIKLAKWMAYRYFCNISDCIKLMLPPGTTTKTIANRVNEKKQNFVYLTATEEQIEQDIENKKLKSDKQIRALRFLLNNNCEILSTDLQMFADVTNAVIKTLEKNGYIEIVEKEVERNPFIHKVVERSKNLELTDEQEQAFEQINASLQIGEYDEFLLFGVTGSRKNRNIYKTNRRGFKTWKI